jgi:hypothetical protein
VWRRERVGRTSVEGVGEDLAALSVAVVREHLAALGEAMVGEDPVAFGEAAVTEMNVEERARAAWTQQRWARR